MPRRLLIAAAVLVLLGCRGSRAPVKPEPSLYGPDGVLRADASGLKSTVVSPTLDAPIVPGKNVLWCSPFQLAWNEMCDLLGGDVRIAGGSSVADSLNRHVGTKADLDDASYVAMAGLVSEDFWDKVRKALAEKFPGETFRLVEPPSIHEWAAYAALVKNLEFAIPFESLDDRVVNFGDRPVRWFGVTHESRHPAEFYEQVIVYPPAAKRVEPEKTPGARTSQEHGASTVPDAPADLTTDVPDFHMNPNPDEFVVELKTKSPDDRLILARVNPCATLEATVGYVQEWIERSNPSRIDPLVDLAVPKLDLDLRRAYHELEGRRVLNVGGEPILDAKQDIRFRLNERGAMLKSEATITFGGGPSRFIFDRPFLILMERKGAKVPYFALWVGTSELLVPEDPARVALLKQLPFDEVRPFSEGLAAVRVAEKWGFIDDHGRWIVKPKFDMAGDFHDGFACFVVETKPPPPKPPVAAKPSPPKRPVAAREPDAPGANPSPLKGFVTTKEGDVYVVRDGAVTRQGKEDTTPPELVSIMGFGFIDRRGKTVIPPQYTFALDFSEGLAAVCVGGKPLTIEDVRGLSSQGIFSWDIPQVDGKWGFVDKTGKRVVEAKYDWAESFQDGLALVARRTPKKEGEEDKDLDSFSGDSVFRKGHKGRYSFIDRSGRNVFGREFTGAEEFSEGLALVGLDDEHSAYIDRTGKIVIEPRTVVCGQFHEGRAVAALDGKYGFIDRTGRFFEWKFNAAAWEESSDGRMQFEDNATKLDGFSDLEGNVVIPAQFTYARDFSEGRAAVIKKDAEFGFIDTDGRPVTSFEFEDARSFREGLAPVRVEGKGWGYLDKAGAFALEPRFETASDFSTGFAVVSLGGKAGVIDAKGRFVVQPLFSEVREFREGFAPVAIQTGTAEYGGPIFKWGFVDRTGKVLEITDR